MVESVKVNLLNLYQSSLPSDFYFYYFGEGLLGCLSLEADTSPQGFNDDTDVYFICILLHIYLLVAHDLSSPILAQCEVFGVY